MRLESKKYLYDIARAAAMALNFVAGKSFSDYTADPMLRSAVERQLEIVGEALSRLDKIDPATASQITEYKLIISFRNILIQGYANVDDRIVWSALEAKVPILRREAEALLGADEPKGAKH
jgi:uncharacterized protein with HEPN domain